MRRIEKIVTAYEAELLERIPAAHRAGFVAGVRASVERIVVLAPVGRFQANCARQQSNGSPT